jgi:transcriptional regulator with XRE-family HTH domain
MDGLGEQLARHLSANLRSLRAARQLTQRQLAARAGVPRATLAHLETGAGNPTLQVAVRLATALGVRLDELVSPPRATGRLVPAAEVVEHDRGGVSVRELLPEPIPDVVVERLCFGVGTGMRGSPHTAGTREYLYCERGRIGLTASGTSWVLSPGDVVIFRGDQPHGYRNAGDVEAVAMSVVLLPPPGS